MKIVIVGGGFGGLKAALELSRRGAKDIVLISDRAQFVHHGLLYSTITGHDEKESVIDILDILKDHPNVTFFHDAVTSIDVRSQHVVGKKQRYPYDQLVLALGVVDNFYGIDGAKQYSYGVGVLESAKQFGRVFHDRVAEDAGDVVCAVIGGGVSGVEMAGALAEYAERIMDGHGAVKRKVKIMLIEKSDRLLPGMSPTASRLIHRRLEKMGVDVRLNQYIDRIGKTFIVVNAEKVKIDMAAWTCGGKMNPLLASQPEMFHISERGRAIVNQYMSAYPNIYVIGDSADTPMSGSATTAMRDGIFVAKHLTDIANGRHHVQVRGRSKPPLLSIPISRFWAYSEKRGIYASGLSGAVVRRFVELNSYCHLMPLGRAVKRWCGHRKSSAFCTTCGRNKNRPTKTLAKA